MKIKAVLLSVFVAFAVFGQKDEGDGSAGSPVLSAPTIASPNLIRGALLFDQTGNPGGNSIPDQNFEAAFDAYDCMGADDFSVPVDREWTINQVAVVGLYTGSGVATGVTVGFHDDAGGLPGALITSFNSIAPTSDTAGSFVVDLPAPVILGEGTYWMSFQVDKSFGGGSGQHFWSETLNSNGNIAAWINPGDGFGSGCTNWNTTAFCGVGSGTPANLEFSLSGEDNAAITIPTLGEIGLAVFLVLLMGTALVFLRRQRAAAA